MIFLKEKKNRRFQRNRNNKKKLNFLLFFLIKKFQPFSKFLFLEFETQDKLEYTWFPAGSNGVVFRVRASNDAHIALTSSEAESDPMLEVFIGGWSNSKSVIRRNRTKPEVAEEATPSILDAGEFRGFWIRWTDNVVTVGREGEAAAFLSYNMSESFPINFVGVCTGW